MNASQHRETPFEFLDVAQLANAFRVTCVSRTNHTSRIPPLEIDEKKFTEEEMIAIQGVLEIFEKKFAVVYSEWTTNPTRLNDVFTKAAEAEERTSVAKAEADKLQLNIQAAEQRLAMLADQTPKG